jgi:hypothetical protein
MGLRGPKKGTGGRPRAKINWERAELAAKYHASVGDITIESGVSRTALDNACLREHGVTLREWAEQRRGYGHNMLRAIAIKSAHKGSTAMQIFLLKNWCKMSDNGPLEDMDGEEIKRTFTLKVEGLEPTIDAPDEAKD